MYTLGEELTRAAERRMAWDFVGARATQSASPNEIGSDERKTKWASTIDAF